MAGTLLTSVVRRLSASGVAPVALVCLLGGGGPAAAFEAWDGRLQVHGFYEMQLRTLANDYDFSDDIDIAQWYHVLNVEIEADLLPYGAGPISYLAAFARVEARFDCVYSRNCSLSGDSAWGDRADHLPNRLASSRREGFDGVVFTGDTRRRHRIPIDQLDFEFKNEPVGDSREPLFVWNVPGVSTLFTTAPGPDGLFGAPTKAGADRVLGTADDGTPDDPVFFTLARYVRPGEELRFASRAIKGPFDGRGSQILGPWLPRNEVVPLAALADVPNPFNAADFNPSAGGFGSTELPFRPAPNGRASRLSSSGDPAEARGLFVPNRAVADLMRDDRFDVFDQNFRESELQWNRGGSQQDEKELKEIYLDIEMLDGRLWFRLGKQSIVWGKTELFRTTDQFNPQDIALASLPSLEESRIALWALRMVYSLGYVGPLEDVRLELAVNLDDFEPTDLGACGEPYTPNPVCNLSLGLFAHGAAGFGLAGMRRPPHWWNDSHGLEYGARIEWRMGIASFALTDFYGFSDMPYIERAFLYERNVDPRTGRIRRAGSRFGCDPEGLFDGDTRGCLGPDDDALRNSPVNQQAFAAICSASIGFTDLDPSVCAQSVFNSQTIITQFIGIDVAPSDALGQVLVGRSLGATILSQPDFAAIPTMLASNVLVGLNVDPMDGGPPVGRRAILCTDGGIRFVFGAPAGGNNPTCLSEFLTDQQEALLGCGPFFGIDCDVDGIDLLNAELSALIQSWPGFPGSFSLTGWDTFDAGRAQPGTVGFGGGPVCTRFEGGETWVLPGCRGPGDAGYDPAVDGSAAGLAHPFTGQPFRSEMAALSWNLLTTLVALSGLGTPESERALDDFLPSSPFRDDGCSFRHPELCANIQAIFSVTHTTRSTARAGGNDRFGRTDFTWHVGGSGVARFQKRNVLGFSMDFVEDRTKTSWSIETTWFNDVWMTDNDEFDGLTEVDTYNLTVSVDRPTFVNFLNSNRTFFVNSQWFFQYVSGYRESFESNGPFNVLATLTINTGYYQDRLLPGVTFVYDFGSNSGAVLPAATYRFSERFSATLGMAIFYGRFEKKPRAIAPLDTPGTTVGRHKDSVFVENGLAPVRDRDEIFLRLRYTF